MSLHIPNYIDSKYDMLATTNAAQPKQCVFKRWTQTNMRASCIQIRVMSTESRLPIDRCKHRRWNINNDIINWCDKWSGLCCWQWTLLHLSAAERAAYPIIILNTHNYRYNHDNCFDSIDCLPFFLFISFDNQIDFIQLFIPLISMRFLWKFSLKSISIRISWNKLQSFPSVSQHVYEIRLALCLRLIFQHGNKHDTLW